MPDSNQATLLIGQKQSQANPGGFSDVFDRIINSRTVDIGRVLGASAIFYFHIGTQRYCPFSVLGDAAVEYFVMLAGISYILFARSRPSTPYEYLYYLKKRLALLAPMFILVNLAFYLASFLYPSALGRPFRFVEFLASATGTSQYLGWKYISTVMWFMPFIMQVYLLFPLIDWVARRVNPVVLVLMAFGFSYLLAHAVPFLVQAPIRPGLVCKNWSPVLRLPEVCVGIILGRIALTRHGPWSGILAVAIYGALSVLVSLPPLESTFSPYYMPWAGFVTPVVLFGVATLISPLFGGITPKWLRVLGFASYSFFLLHAAPISTVNNHFHPNIIMWMAYYFACWAVAIALNLVLDRAQNLLAGGWRRQKN